VLDEVRTLRGELPMYAVNRMKCCCALIATAVLLAPVTTIAHPKGLATEDVAAIRNTLQRFRDAWLRGKPDEVMAELTPDAVIMPHHGVKPRAGAAAVKAFWWPTNSPSATVTRFDQIHDEIAGDGDIAYVRGSATVEYEWGEVGKERRYRNVGTTLTVLRRAGPQQWRISLRMWDDPPTEDLGPVNPAENHD
jgi:ketosteroid isomerase-like protein